jgi:hypothetical protein
MQIIRCVVIAGLVAFGVVSAAQAQNAFSFVAIGDMPYGVREVVYPKYKALIGAINSVAPDFTIHVGDIKSGSSCAPMRSSPTSSIS